MGLSWDATKVEGFDSLTEDETVTNVWDCHERWNVPSSL